MELEAEETEEPHLLWDILPQVEVEAVQAQGEMEEQVGVLEATEVTEAEDRLAETEGLMAGVVGIVQTQPLEQAVLMEEMVAQELTEVTELP